MTQPDLFPAPAPAESHQESVPTEWRELTWMNGRRYRWRIHPDRIWSPELFEAKAPDSWRWELEHQADDEWLPTRFWNRRDAIWNHVRDEALSLVRGD